MTTINDLTDPALVRLDLEGHDRDAAVRALADALHDAGRVTDTDGFVA